MEPELNNITSIIIMYLPVIIAVVGEVLAFANNMKKYNDITGSFSKIRDEIKDKTELNDVKEQIVNVLHENAELKRQLAELIQKIDKVKTVSTKE